MTTIQVISLDMFQTLVSLDNRFISMWRQILKDRYNESEARTLQAKLIEQYYIVAMRMRENHQFVLTRDIYKECFDELLPSLGISYDCAEVVDVLIQEHRQAELYEETLDFLDFILKNYRVCIVTDTDEDMLPRFFEAYRIPLFSSEKYRSYKNDHDNSMFQEIIKYYDIEPAGILHIGDTVSNVVGAQRAGIQACWINRHQEPWTLAKTPDYIIRNLNEIRNNINKTINC
ncbi:HAD family hydrolase [Paenibacillus sp. D2_2]|uniref:HAD family hydrolase n=1 Tax=Paenibacillus sp. D2_2 TaxID=3073092 RepID=UPI0028152D4B|nr:HAD family hydrolase [Paenibacillus sp. D2_2]WMT41276.1 HAD family hydrolase [Paenibacillus sp. D2_2]